MIFANKQDIEGAMTPSEVANALGLTSITTHKYQIFKTSAIKGTGLEEAMEWWVLLAHSFFPTDLLLEFRNQTLVPSSTSVLAMLHSFDFFYPSLSFCESHTRLNNLICICSNVSHVSKKSLKKRPPVIKSILTSM